LNLISRRSDNRAQSSHFAMFGIFLMSALLSFTGCGEDQSAEGGPGGGGGGFPPIPVEMAAVSQETVTDRFEAVGTVEANDAVTIVSQIDALVRELPFREGQAIAKGAVIAQLDDAQLRAEEARANAVLTQRQNAFDRIQKLVEQQLSAQQEHDDATAALSVAKADVALIRARLDKTRITAPFSGVVGARQVSPGAFIRSGDPITDLAQLDELRIVFSAPERYYPLLNRGAQVTISTSAFPDYELTGTIDIIDPVVDQSTRSTSIVARVKNTDRKFRPGMSANVAAVLNTRENALVIPDQAVFVEGDQSWVFVVGPDSSVARTPITTGSRQRGSVEVTSGLESGMNIVSAGHQKLFSGAKVMPLPTGAPNDSQTPAAAGGH